MSIKKNISKRDVSSVFFIYLYLVSSLIMPIRNVSGLTFRSVEASGDRVAIVDYTVENLEGSMFWGSFLTDYADAEKLYNLYGDIDELTFHMEMNFDKGTISGSLSGSMDYDQYSWKRRLSFRGEFTGWLDKYNWNYNSWLWEFGSNFSLSLTFGYEQRYTNEQSEVFWNSREETIEVIAELYGNSFAGRGGIGGFGVGWEDPGSGVEDQRLFRLGCRNRLSSGGCDLPTDLPEVIDIDAKIVGPENIRDTDSSVTFDIDASGRDLDRVSEVNWYFLYYNEDFGDFWWFKSFERTDLMPLEIDKGTLTDWIWYVTQYGRTVNDEKRLLMQVRVEFMAGEDEWLIETDDYNFTYIVKESSGFDLTLAEGLDVYPTMKNETTFELDLTGTELSDKITFEVSDDLPEYLKVELMKSEAPKSSYGIITNKLNVTLDMTKASGLTLPTEQTITLTAKSKKGAENIETSEQITLNLKPVKWLILHYVAEQTHPFLILQEPDEENIEHILNSFAENKKPQIGYIIQIDLETPWKTTYYEDTLSRGGHLLRLYDGKLEKIESKTLNMASPESLKNFVEKAHTLIPSEKSHLIITNHGNGIQGMAFEGIKEISTVDTVDSLTPSELESALRDHHYDIITFETCNSALIETFYEIRGVTDYVIASQFAMYGSGLFYENFIPKLLSKPNMTPLEHATSITDTYVHPTKKSSLSLIKTAALVDLTSKIDGLSMEIRKGYAENSEEFHKEIMRVYKKTTFTGGGGTIDLFDFCDKITESSRLSSLIKDKAQAVLDVSDSVVLKNKVQNAGKMKVLTSRGLVPIEGEEAPDEPDKPVSSWVLDESPRTLNGLSIWFWGSGSEGEGYTVQKASFDSTEFAKNTAWKGFIEDYVKGKSEPKVVVTVDQHKKNLFVRIVDSDGSIVGFDPESETKNKVVLDYQDAVYYRSPDGTTQIILPAGLAVFTTVVDGGSMEEEEETYTLDIKIVYNDEILFEETLDYPISVFSEHSIPTQLTDESISIGELSVRDNAPEPEPEPSPEPDAELESPGGIPGFGFESILRGVLLSTFLIWLSRLTLSHPDLARATCTLLKTSYLVLK